MTAYYNEVDPFAAAWLRELIRDGLIAPGHVDDRSIEDVHPADLAGYTQCHFFAGIGVWSYALRLAGVPDDRPVWTGSCPCQPFSAAGKGGGTSDERHLWPAFNHLIESGRPPVVLGEQVASPAGLGWFDLVQADLEGQGYAVWAADLCAASVGAPHIRQRLYWVADAQIGGRGQGSAIERGRDPRGHANEGAGPLHDGTSRRLADADVSPGQPSESWTIERPVSQSDAILRSNGKRPAPPSSFWRDPDWLFCRDGRWRPVESGTFPLVDVAPARVGRLRGYGNAIVAEQAAIFIKAIMT